jgi:oligo-1,6-glucosidase
VGWEQTSGQYLHLFDRKQPDLNWKSPQVRKAVHDTMVWWLDRGVDGFRMDVINFISKSEGLPDAPAIPGQRFVSAMDKFVDGPHVHDYLAEMTREVFDGRDGEFITIGEMPGVTTEQARLYTDPARHELNMVFQFEHVSVDQGPAGKFDYLGLDLVVLKKSLHRWQAALAEIGWNSLYWNNHDRRASCPGSATTTRTIGRLGEGARNRSARHAWYTVRLSRRGTRNDELPVQDSAGPQGHRGRELLQECA